MVPESLMTSTQAVLVAEESYVDLLRSGPHWLFELTLELVTAPLVFAVGWLWRRGLLRHIHRDLGALRRHDRAGRATYSEDCPGEEVEVSGLEADASWNDDDKSQPRGTT